MTVSLASDQKKLHLSFTINPFLHLVTGQRSLLAISRRKLRVVPSIAIACISLKLSIVTLIEAKSMIVSA